MMPNLADSGLAFVIKCISVGDPDSSNPGLDPDSTFQVNPYTGY
jgi:hypothetical protein